MIEYIRKSRTIHSQTTNIYDKKGNPCTLRMQAPSRPASPLTLVFCEEPIRSSNQPTSDFSLRSLVFLQSGGRHLVRDWGKLQKQKLWEISQPTNDFSLKIKYEKSACAKNIDRLQLKHNRHL